MVEIRKRDERKSKEQMQRTEKEKRTTKTDKAEIERRMRQNN